MKILIIGEYSGFAKNLKIGFESLGHDVIIFHEGDGWKKIDLGKNTYSYPFRRNFIFCGKSIRYSWFFRGLYYFPKFKIDKGKYSNYFDNVLIINYEFIRLSYQFWCPRFSMNDIKSVTKKQSKIFLSACGDDYVYLSYISNFRYFSSIQFNSATHKYFSKNLLKTFECVIKNINGVIPIMCEYAITYREYQKQNSDIKVFNTIPLPIEIIKNNTSNQFSKKKIVIFHGLNRISKGSDIIIDALKKISEKYPEKIEVVIEGKIPLEKYLEIIKKAHIVIDQCYSYSYGMNGLYSLALGKVVLSGNEPENEIEFRCKCPVINILPDEDDIFAKLEYFIQNPNEIEIISKKSVDYVEKLHDSIIVAQKYIDTFLSE